MNMAGGSTLKCMERPGCPSVDPYWAPYSVGRWCYRPFYGWTWVSYEPWGWLPYHYGRWHRNSIYGWCWLPGPSFAFNFWSPGLVTFYHRPGWVSWCPFSPRRLLRHTKLSLPSWNLWPPDGGAAQIAYEAARGSLQPRCARRLPNGTASGAVQNGSFEGREKQNTRWGNVDRPWDQGTLVKDRLEIQPTSKSFSAATDRVTVPSECQETLPAVVRNVPARESSNGEQFTRITNPQIRSISSGSMRRVEPETDARDTSRTNGRVVQIPQNPSSDNPVDRRTNSSPRSGGRANSGETSGTRNRSTQPARPENPAPPNQQNSNPQNPARWRIERAVPEQQTTPQPAPQSSPRSEFRQESERSLERPGIGRWSDSGSGSATSSPGVGARTFTVPRSDSGGRRTDSNSADVRPSEADNAPAFVFPRSDDGGRGSNPNPRIESAPDAGRTSTYSFPRPSNPSVERSGGSRPSASSQSSGTGSPGRSVPEGNAGRRR